ncbi:MAG: phosphate signaling complex protein PhoU [Candidatus Faecousia sp.]|nr:phosphate signaling complex protein PhoU [Bacillota bacterium]MDY4220310.1 phosphate signaling complex protein PhoU [Candidatus Faecousia sp.]
MRNHFDQQLEKLHEDLITMGGLCETAIGAAVEAVTKGDAEMAKQAMADDSKIDEMERTIEHLCLKLLLQQQPVARDLRTISSALKMISDMERIGDQATDIAEIAKFIQGKHQQTNATLHTMATAAIHMVKESVDSFVRRDQALARKVIGDDDLVDSLFDDTKRQLIEFISRDASNGEYYLDLLMIAKYLERIADHATNIAEWVLFSITGRHEN